jgi:hypothetical protein
MPTVVRSYFFPETVSSSSVERYGDLINESFNTLTFLQPYLKSFGVIGGFLVITSLLIFSSFVYRRLVIGARIFELLFYPYLATSILLSFFSNYFLILTVVLSPLACAYCSKILRIVPYSLSHGP